MLAALQYTQAQDFYLINLLGIYAAPHACQAWQLHEGFSP